MLSSTLLFPSLIFAAFVSAIFRSPASRLCQIWVASIHLKFKSGNMMASQRHDLCSLKDTFAHGASLFLEHFVIHLNSMASDCLQGANQVAKWNGTRVSVKTLDKDSYSDPERINAFKHELTLVEKVWRPNVVQFVGAVTHNIPMMIVVGYNPKGGLGVYLQKKGRLSPSEALTFALDIARGIK